MYDFEDAAKGDERADRVSAYTALEKAELEAQAVAAIGQLRHLVAAAEALYQDWLRAENDPTYTETALRVVQADYLRRQRGLLDKQETVSELIEALGYVPVCPASQTQAVIPEP